MMRWGLLKGGILMTVMKWERSCAGGVGSWASMCVCVVYLEPRRRVWLQGEDLCNTRPWREIVQGVGGGHSGSERGWMGTGRGNRTTPDLSPGTAQPWVVITNHTSHFWGDTLPPPSVSFKGMRAGLKSPAARVRRAGLFLTRPVKKRKTTPQQLQQQVHHDLNQHV